MKNKTIIFLILLTALSAWVRLYRLENLPPSLNWDEVSLGYNAASILKTGADEWGVKFPLIFRAFGDYKLPFYVYVTSISEAVFGHVDWAVRLPSAVAGVVSSVLVFLIAQRLFSNKFLPSAFAALLFCLSPWGVFLSRPALEGNLAGCLILLGIYGLLSGRLSLGLVAFALSLQTYYVARLFVPVILVVWWFTLGRGFTLRKGSITQDINFRRVKLGLVVFLVSLFIVIFQTFWGPGANRYNWISLVDQGTVARIGQMRSQSVFSPVLTRLMFNKVTVGSAIFVGNYLSHFSPGYLFFFGGTNYQFSLPEYGLLFPFVLPFFYLGIILAVYQIARSRSLRSYQSFLILWLATAPVASALTRDTPHPLRSLILLAPAVLVAVFGLWNVLKLVKYTYLRQSAWVLLTVAVGAAFFSFWSTYTGPYTRAYSWVWQYSYRQAIAVIKADYPRENRIIISKSYGEPHEFVLWDWPWAPASYPSDPHLIRYFQSNWYWVDAFDKFVFVNDWEVKQKESALALPGRTLLVTTPGNYQGGQLVETIKFLDGQPAFDIVQL